MELVYTQNYEIKDNMVDCFGNLKSAQILFIAQDMGTRHCKELSLSYDTLAGRRMFWAVWRHRVQITRLPKSGETICVETWAMPHTQVAYPRSVVAYDEKGRELFRAITLWVLKNMDTRESIRPGESGIEVPEVVRGLEISNPKGIVPRDMVNSSPRSVGFADLDRNGHMNNTRYIEWAENLFTSRFHREHKLKEFTVCYEAECWEGQVLDMHYDLLEDNTIQVDAYRTENGKAVRVLSTRMLYA